MAPFSTDHDPRALFTARPQPAPAPLPQVVTAAVERFSCIGGACEDTCCRDWAVTIDRPSLERMKETLARSGSPKEGAGLVHLVVLGKPSRHADGLAHIQMRDDGTCPLLEEDHSCRVQTNFGESALSTTCSVFPRTAIEVAGNVEVNGSLACPEMARLVLLTSDGLDRKPTERPALPRPYLGKRVGQDPDDAYAAHFPAVRETMIALFAQNHRPLAARFVAAAHLADRLEDFYHAGTAAFTGAQRAFAERRLQTELTAALDPALLDSLQADLAGLDVPAAPVTALVISLLQQRRQLPHAARFGDLLVQVFTSLQSEALGHEPRTGDEVDAEVLAEIYRARRDALDSRFPGVMGRIFGNYAQHFWLRHPYTDVSTLQQHLYRLGLELATARLLLIGHPRLAKLVRSEGIQHGDAATVEEVAVAAIQTMTKAIAHQVDFVQTVLQTAGQSGGFTLGRAVLLAKFI